MNLLQNIDHLSDLFIRPQRYIYRMVDLGMRQFSIEDFKVQRTDYKIKNQKGYTLECSLFSTKKLSELSKIIVYMHCNSGCRLEGIPYVGEAIVAGFGLFVFDFAGSGNSEGKYVSLGTIVCIENEGFHESKDISTVVSFIRQANPLISICLWGRSMGAAATIKYLAEDSSIHLAILDSPFSSVRQLAMELGRNKTPLPQLFVSLLLSYLKSVVKERAEFDIDDLNLTEIVKNIKVPAIFLSCEKDQLVPFKQSQNLFNLYPASKQLLIIEEEHNQTRTKQTIQRVFKAIQKQMNRSIVLTQQSSKKKEKIKKKLHLTHSHRQLNMGRYSVPISDSCSILRLGSIPTIKVTEKALPVIKSAIDLTVLPQIKIATEKIALESKPLANKPSLKFKKVQSIHKSQSKNFPLSMIKSCQTMGNERLLSSIDCLPQRPKALEDITYMKHRNTIHHLVSKDPKEPIPRNSWIKRRRNLRPTSNKQNLFE